MSSDQVQVATLVVVSIYTLITFSLLSAQIKQGFENKFFQLLQFHHGIVNAIEHYQGSLPKRGRRNFIDYYNEYVRQYQNLYLENQMEDPLKIIEGSYRNFFHQRQPEIGHYFRNLYHIVKFVDRSWIRKKTFYTDLVRAQLSSHELLLLFYNSLSSMGNDKFKPLIEKYALLKNMPNDQLVSVIHNHTVDHKTFYKQSAFGK
jgi:hypothetical protein